MLSPEIRYNLLCFLQTQLGIVVLAPCSQASQPAPVDCLIVAVDETRHSCVVCKLELLGGGFDVVQD